MKKLKFKKFEEVKLFVVNFAGGWYGDESDELSKEFESKWSENDDISDDEFYSFMMNFCDENDDIEVVDEYIKNW